jgi:hypothetical protein
VNEEALAHWGLSRKKTNKLWSKIRNASVYGVVPEVVAFWVITLLYLPVPVRSQHPNPKQYMELCVAAPKVEV